MSIQELEVLLKTPVDPYGHALGGEHYEYHEAPRNPGELPLVALERTLKERHNGYEVAECSIGHEAFLRGKGRSEYDYCGGPHRVAV